MHGIFTSGTRLLRSITETSDACIISRKFKGHNLCSEETFILPHSCWVRQTSDDDKISPIYSVQTCTAHRNVSSDKCNEQQCSICISFLLQSWSQTPASHSTSLTAAWSVSKSSQTRSHFPPPQPAILSAHEPNEPNCLLQNRLIVETRPCWHSSSSRQRYPIPYYVFNIYIYSPCNNEQLHNCTK